MTKRLLALAGLMLVLAGCGSDPLADALNGRLDFNRDLTVGEAFTRYAFCKNARFELFEKGAAKNIIQATCDIPLEAYAGQKIGEAELSPELLAKARSAITGMRYTFNFAQDPKTKKMEVIYAGLLVRSPNNATEEAPADLTEALGAIFANRPDPNVFDLLKATGQDS